MTQIEDLKEEDVVNHPKHYNRDGAMEMIDELEIIYGTENAKLFCEMNVHKYRYRAGFKKEADRETDLKKADWYMKKAAEYYEKMQGD